MPDCGTYNDYTIVNEWSDDECAYKLVKCNRCGLMWEIHTWSREALRDA